MINFIFPYNNNEESNWTICGPLTSYLTDNHQHSYDFEIIRDHKNIIVFETVEKFKGFIRNKDKKNLNNEKIIDFLKKNKDLKIIITSIADAAVDYEKQEIIKLIESQNLQDRTYYVESNFRHKNDKNTFCWHFFIEDAGENQQHIFHNQDNQLGYVSEQIEIHETDKFREKKFLCFNRTMDRAHRLSLLYDYLNNDFSDSYFSFLVYNSNYSSIFQFNPNSFDCRQFNKVLPIELDTFHTEDKQGFRVGDAIGKKQFYLNSCIHIVTESSFIQNELFLTEKILKPILNYQPFIVLGSFNYIKELKRIGFKTFSEFWDESYDEIENPKDRYFAVMKIVLELNSKSIEELNEIYQKTKNICIYNREVIKNKKHSIDEFIKKIENEW